MSLFKLADDFFRERNKKHFQKFKILHFLDNITKITMIHNFPCSEKCTTSFLRENCAMELIPYIVKFKGFKIFGYEFGEWFLFRSQKNSPVNLLDFMAYR